MSDKSSANEQLKQRCRQYSSALRAMATHSETHGFDTLVAAAAEFAPVAEQSSTDAFTLLLTALQHLSSDWQSRGELPNSLERELLILIADWLDQLAILESQNLPLPRTLVRELLYSVELVERSRGADSLQQLLEDEPIDKKPGTDPFADDPELPGDSGAADADLFAEDPGFGMVYDLFQRTLTVECRKGAGAVVVDPFIGDAGFDEL